MKHFTTKIKINHTLDFEIVPDNKFTGIQNEKKIVERSKCRFLFSMKKTDYKESSQDKNTSANLRIFCLSSLMTKNGSSKNGFEKHCL